MEAKTILDTYKRYLQTLKSKDSELFTNYSKIKDFIDKHCDDQELFGLLYRHCIGSNIREIRHRNFKIKDLCTEGWSSAAVKEGYELLKNLKRYEFPLEEKAYAINFKKFAELADNQNAHVELYLWYCFSNECGDSLFRVTMQEIEEAAYQALKAEKEASTEIETPTEA
ncbi:hypothetical protein [Prevotella sp. P6B4]|uniref:hypothetical protein n=1 Tax=Prevotella sp. P6B4 TaxID=1410614 RepID=UPI00048E56F0|nr:hypothetical protein [Prevotella sp. P6B4]